jgi:HlyD family secretion protein
VHVAEKRIDIASLNVQQASHNLDLAKREYERFSTLIRSGSVNQQMFDRTENEYKQAVLAKKQADAAYESARAEQAKVLSKLSLLNKNLEDCFPTSPLSGVVTDKYVEAGEWTTTGKPLVKIARLDTVWVKVYLPPEDLTRIVLGGSAEVDPEDGRNKVLEGRVSWIASEAEFTPKNIQTEEARAALVYAVKVNVPNPGGMLKIGMPVSVRIK